MIEYLKVKIHTRSYIISSDKQFGTGNIHIIWSMDGVRQYQLTMIKDFIKEYVPRNCKKISLVHESFSD